MDGAIIWGLADGYFNEELVIPDTLLIAGDNVEVIGVGADSFAQLGIKTLELGEFVKNIGVNAFSGNEIEELLIPDNLENIEKDAFRDNKITDLDLNAVVSVGETAFANNQLTDLGLGNALTESSIYLDRRYNNCRL